jgi:hypothetical protein
VILLAYFLTHKRADPGPVAGPVLV